MITVVELIAKLQTLPPTAVVAGYAGNAESSFPIEKVEVITEDEQPYDKGDQLYTKLDEPKPAQVVLLTGWD